MLGYSDYIVYVDESGDHGLTSINQDYPMFVLAFCIFHKSTYSNSIVPALLEFKFRHFGHDMVVLHERDIRKQKGAFGILRNRDARELFLNELTEFIINARFTLIAVAIKKNDLVGKYIHPLNPYEMAMKFGLERVYGFLAHKNRHQAETPIIFESRGSREDRDLELEFRRVCDGNNYQGVRFPFRIKNGIQTNQFMRIADCRPYCKTSGTALSQPGQPQPRLCRT